MFYGPRPKLGKTRLALNYDTRITTRRLKTQGENWTLKDFHNSEQYNARMVNTMSYFYHASHCVVIDSNVENTDRRSFSTLNFRLDVILRRHCNI